MIVEVRNAFKDNVNSIPWMDNITKEVVMEKVGPCVGLVTHYHASVIWLIRSSMSWFNSQSETSGDTKFF